MRKIRCRRAEVLRLGVGGPVGSGKTALVDSLCKRMRERFNIAVVTNDIYTREDAEFLIRSQALPPERIRGVETGGCPHTAIREDASMNLAAIDGLMQEFTGLDMIIVESGGDNLAATFSPELSDLTLYVIDVAAGDKIPRKGGPGIIRSDLLIINKIDLAPHVGASLEVMDRDARKMRGRATLRVHELENGRRTGQGDRVHRARRNVEAVVPCFYRARVRTARAAAAARFSTPSFTKTCSRCLFTVRGLMARISPISRLALPRLIHSSTSASRVVSDSVLCNCCSSPRVPSFGQPEQQFVRPGAAQHGDLQPPRADFHDGSWPSPSRPAVTASAAGPTARRQARSLFVRDAGEQIREQCPGLGRGPQQPAVPIRRQQETSGRVQRRVRAGAAIRALARCTRMRASSSSITMGLAT